jgi:hypothetical protein
MTVVVTVTKAQVSADAKLQAPDNFICEWEVKMRERERGRERERERKLISDLIIKHSVRYLERNCSHSWDVFVGELWCQANLWQ